MAAAPAAVISISCAAAVHEAVSGVSRLFEFEVQDGNTNNCVRNIFGFVERGNLRYFCPSSVFC